MFVVWFVFVFVYLYLTNEIHTRDGAWQQAFESITKAISTSTGRDAIATQFNSCQRLSTPNDTATFVQNLANYFQGVVQYNNELPGQPTIAQMCNIMTEVGDPVDKLVTMIKKLFLGGACMDNSYADSVITVMNTVSI